MRAPPDELPIRLEDMSVHARGVVILDGISLTFHRGEPTVLLGSGQLP
jgi:ABC-type transporter Mla maintaining outer membrane lipid asymmetry ATPase subunit MlaF